MRSNPLLSDGDGRRLLGAQFADSFGVGVSTVALPWIVLDHSGSAGLAGLVFAITVLPYVVFGLFAGALADHRSRKRVMIWAHAAQTVAIAPVPLLAFAGHVPIAVVLVSAFMVGAGRTYADAAAFGAIAEIVGPNRFVEGQAALSTAWAIGLVSGPRARRAADRALRRARGGHGGGGRVRRGGAVVPRHPQAARRAEARRRHVAAGGRRRGRARDPGHAAAAPAQHDRAGLERRHRGRRGPDRAVRARDARAATRPRRAGCWPPARSPAYSQVRWSTGWRRAWAGSGCSPRRSS